jgi:hypothetical protein
LFLLVIDALVSELAQELARYQIGDRGTPEIARVTAQIVATGQMIDALVNDEETAVSLHIAEAACCEATCAGLAPYTYTKSRGAKLEDVGTNSNSDPDSDTAHTPAPSLT